MSKPSLSGRATQRLAAKTAQRLDAIALEAPLPPTQRVAGFADGKVQLQSTRGMTIAESATTGTLKIGSPVALRGDMAIATPTERFRRRWSA